MHSFFFFKQKTAYEMRISDWSSDVCSSDLIEDYLANRPLNLVATIDRDTAYKGADFVVVATPTDYDPDSNYFNTRTVESVIADALVMAPDALIIVKSTVPVGFTDRMRAELGTDAIVFSPEFLREGRDRKSTRLHS